jgi:hypothetical protein
MWHEWEHGGGHACVRDAQNVQKSLLESVKPNALNAAHVKFPGTQLIDQFIVVHKNVCKNNGYFDYLTSKFN